MGQIRTVVKSALLSIVLATAFTMAYAALFNGIGVVAELLWFVIAIGGTVVLTRSWGDVWYSVGRAVAQKK